MTAYISLLRGINVAGQKKILMKDLKALYETLGFSAVTTYIQSGNVVFESALTNTEVKTTLETNIAQHYGFSVPIMVLEKTQFKLSLTNMPFENINLQADGTKVLVSYLSETPNDELVTKLLSYVKAPERLVINGAILYLHCPNGYGKTKLSNNFIENKLKLIATTRNLKSVHKLAHLLDTD